MTLQRPFLVLLVALTGPALAGATQQGRIRYVEGGVSVQRSQETYVEEALPNMPFLPGDRIWSDGTGRAEFQLPDGVLLRLDVRGKLEYQAFDEQARRAVLQLWSGVVEISSRGKAALELGSPGGTVYVEEEAAARVEVDGAEAMVAVRDGSVVLESGGRSVTVMEGRTAMARDDQPPGKPKRFDRDDTDEFDNWVEGRERGTSRSANSSRYLPEELTSYADDFDSQGSWYVEAGVGNVWRPRVSAGWSPYSDGRWVWTAYGWTWVPYESWGWAPSHYGRWGYGSGSGWYWVPGSVWGPAWVHWAVGGSYVGWCPMDHHDRPLQIPNQASMNRAVPRSSLIANGNGWRFLRGSDLSARDGARRRVEVDASSLGNLNVVSAALAQPTRDGRSVREYNLRDVATALARAPHNRPGAGDTVPDSQADSRTSIPRATYRRGSAEDAPRPSQRYFTERSGSSGTRGTAAQPAPVSGTQPDNAQAGEPRSNGAIFRRVQRRDPEETSGQGGESRPSEDGSRRVLRRIFGSLDEGDKRPARGDQAQDRTERVKRESGEDRSTTRERVSRPDPTPRSSETSRESRPQRVREESAPRPTASTKPASSERSASDRAPSRKANRE
jgi:hypothetical protein